MNDQKLENLLNLALDATDAEREKSLNMNFGYDRRNRIWELIVRYHGDLSGVGERTKEIILLSGGYAIITAEESEIDWISSQPEVEYIEKPKRLFFSAAQGRSASCINPLQTGAFDLRGQGVLVAVIDSGVDYFHPDFRNEDGTTRIVALWDQTIPKSKRNDAMETDTTSEGENRSEEGTEDTGKIKEGTGEEIRGVEYTKEQINEALASSTPEERFALVPSRDVTGHGTAVLGIAAGNGRSSADAAMQGVAPEATLVVVKLGNPDPADLPRTSQLLQAVDFCVRYALLVERPLVINLSFGNNYGSHSGDSLLETYLNAVSNLGQNVICIGAGNEGDTGRHYAGNLKSDRKSSGQTQTVRATSDPAATSAVSATADRAVSVEFQVGAYESSFSLQIWKVYGDEISIELISPGGIRSGTLSPVLGTARLTLGPTELLLFYGMPSPYSQAQEIYLTFQGAGNHLSLSLIHI